MYTFILNGTVGWVLTKNVQNEKIVHIVSECVLPFLIPSQAMQETG